MKSLFYSLCALILVSTYLQSQSYNAGGVGTSGSFGGTGSSGTITVDENLTKRKELLLKELAAIEAQIVAQRIKNQTSFGNF